MDDTSEAGELRTFQIGKLRIHPAVEGTFTLGETVHVLAQVLGDASEARLELALSTMLGRHVDLRTPTELSRYFRDETVANAEVQYASG